MKWSPYSRRLVPAHTPRLARALLAFATASLFLLSACESCKTSKLAGPTSPEAKPDEAPTARLFIVSDLAGALEPCGCVKDQLGGMDHFGGLVHRQAPKAKAEAIVTAGPTFFMDMELSEDKRAQEVAKASTIARSLKALGLVAFAPARNEWAAGPEVLGQVVQESGAAMVAGNLTSQPKAEGWVVRQIGGLRVGIVGVAAPDRAKVPIEGVTSTSPAEAVRAGIDALAKERVDTVIALASVGRGEAKRIADLNPELLAIVVGEPGASGDANTKAPPVERVGDVLILQTANHLQTAGVLDLYVRKPEHTGRRTFADATGIERMRKHGELAARITELRARIATWETDKAVTKDDLEARRRDLARLETEQKALEVAPVPSEGDFYRYTSIDVRDGAGADAQVKAQMSAYYKQVNDHNKVAFADRIPKAPAPGEPGYAGIEACSACHPGARAVWDKTAHAQAYATLSSQYKEFNLDCVSCHVTGYDRPGGSTVTHVASLTNVQCEVCHGPGALHAKNPGKEAVPTPHPTATTCEACHHPPHVHSFDAAAKMKLILGPGHGEPVTGR